MDSDALAVVIIIVTFLITVSGSVLLFPISRHLGAYLRALTEERRGRPPRVEGEAQLLEALGRIERRLELLEDRQEFSEQLLQQRTPAQVPSRTDAPRGS